MQMLHNLSQRHHDLSELCCSLSPQQSAYRYSHAASASHNPLHKSSGPSCDVTSASSPRCLVWSMLESAFATSSAVPVYDGVYHTPVGRFSKRDCSTTKRVPIPNGTSLESSQRDGFKPPLFWHRYYSNCEDIEHGKSAQGCVIYAVVYGVSNVKCRFSIYSAQSNYRCVGGDFGNPK